MAEPQVPGSPNDRVELPCGQSVPSETFDMGMREYRCSCGKRHAIVMDVHPVSRWVPESVVTILEEVIDPIDDHPAFGTIHVMGMVMDEYPDSVTVTDTSEDPTVGWAVVWITQFDAKTLHETIVELLVTLMDHAISHSDDATIHERFEDDLGTFDVETFVEAYRDTRDFEDQRKSPY